MARRKSLAGWFNSGIIALNVLLVVLLLISYLTFLVSPQSFWPISLFGIAYPVLLLGNLLFIFYWLLAKPKYALMSLVAILMGWPTLTSTFAFNGKSTILPDSSSLRIMSYNVHMFKDPEVDTLRYDEFINIFREVNPDILCIQEFYSRGKGKFNMQNVLTKNLGYRHHYFQKVAQNDFESYGIAIFSKFPIVNSGALDIHVGERNVNRIQYADVKKDSTTVRVYNVHLQSVGLQKEDLDFLNTKSLSTNQDLHSTKRIGGRLVRAFIKRGEQVDSLYKHVQEHTGPFIIAGDFNDTPSSYAVNRISKLANNAFRARGRGWGITYTGSFPNIQIDYIFSSEHLKVQNYRVIQRKLSDHYPIWSDLQL